MLFKLRLGKELILKELALSLGMSAETAAMLQDMASQRRLLARKMIGSSLHVWCLGVAVTTLLNMCVCVLRDIPRA